ncbi:MAG: hypothetical protein ACR2ND_07195 [Solirubrobacteraceae bacterium]
MSNISTIANLATAGGTLVLGAATFASVRSGQRSARIAERSLLIGLRPVLAAARPDQITEDVRFGDGQTVEIPDGGGAAVLESDGSLYMVIPLRNVGSGLAVLHGWHVTEGHPQTTEHTEVDDFRPLQRDLYVPSGDTGFWQGAVREDDDPYRRAVTSALADGESLTVDLLYGDHEGGQRTISRFVLSPREDQERGWLSGVTRHWYLEAADPRQR